MSKYIFLSAPAQGHVNPILPVVAELVTRGEEVIFYLTEDFRAAVEATGAIFRPYDSLITKIRVPADFSATNMAANAMPMRMVDEGQHVLPQLYQSIRAEQPDFIAYDFMCLWARILARSLHIPAIMLRCSYASNEHTNIMRPRGGPAGRGFSGPEIFQQMNSKLAELCRQYNVEPFPMLEMFGGFEPLTISSIAREFQPHGETFDSRFVFSGPSIKPRAEKITFPLEKLAGQQVLFISLGTVFNDQIQFYNTCIAAFKDTPWLVVLSHGKNISLADLDPIPANFLAAPYVPQLEVLERTTLFITHGGMNSTMESLYYGVPLIAFPQMIEQSMTADRLVELGLGLALDKEHITVEALRAATEQIMQDPTYKEHVLAMQQHVRNAGGYKRAADAIIHYADTLKSTLTI